MFATIRKYTPKPETMTTSSVEQLRRQLHDKFLPIAQKIDGFHGYYAVNAGNKHLLTITICESQAGAAESTRRAAEFVRNNKMPFEPGTPEVSEGQVLTFAEAGREVGAH